MALVPAMGPDANMLHYPKTLAPVFLAKALDVCLLHCNVCLLFFILWKVWLCTSLLIQSRMSMVQRITHLCTHWSGPAPREACRRLCEVPRLAPRSISMPSSDIFSFVHGHINYMLAQLLKIRAAQWTERFSPGTDNMISACRRKKWL